MNILKLYFVRHTKIFLLLLIGFLGSPAIAAPSNNVGVGVRTLAFFDDTRQRPIITEVFYPVQKDTKASLPDNDVWSDLWKREPEARDAPFMQSNHQYPLVLFSHGSHGYRLNNVWLAYALVKKGYIVASVDHYGDTGYLMIPKLEMQIWDRPMDISFALSSLLKHSFIQNKVDTKKIGYVGFSKGGLTGILLAGGMSNISNKMSLTEWKKIVPGFGIDAGVMNSIDFSQAKKSYKNPLIKAAFLMAPAWGNAFEKSGLQHIHTPIHIIAGEADEIVPIKENAEFFSHSIPNSTLTIIPGKVGHFVFLSESTNLGKKSLPSFLVQDDDSVDRHKIHTQVSKQAIEFFSQHIGN